MGRNDPAKAKTVLERFLSVSQTASEREAAFDFWEKAGNAAQQ